MPFEGDPLAFYGRNIIQDYHADLKARLPLKAGRSDSFDISDDQLRHLQETKVGILGAGIGGLYTALILDSLDIEYEILEASDRTGGRIFTHKFPGGGKYDYYDTGAMRFPLPKKDSQGHYKNGVMKRLAELIEYGPLNEGQDRLKDSLIPYYFEARKGSKPGSYYFNGIREPVSDAPKGSFGAQGMGVDADYIRAGVDAIMSDVTEPFIRMLVQDIENGKRTGWEVLRANDSYSLRSYMVTKYLPSAHLKLPPQHLPNNVIGWCDLVGGGGIDDGLAEAIFDLLSDTKIGDTNYGDIEWKCFEGGSQTLPKRIEEYLNTKGDSIRFNKRVTAISQSHMMIEIPTSSPDFELPVDEEEQWDDFIVIDQDKIPNVSTGLRTRRVKIPSVAVTVNGNQTCNYSHVISTLPLPILRTIDLSGAGLNIMQRNALRALEYANALKIGILFKSNWWTTKLGIVGGQTFTDLPIQRIIYPSYGNDSSTPSKVLISSYIWQRDANRLGTLATSKHRDALKELVLRNLAEAHSGLHPDVTYAYLNEEFVDMHVQDWLREEYAMGAGASFGPSGFQDLYSSLTYPAAGKRLHFAGEAVSMHHSWVVGALDSAWRAVYGYLKVTDQDEKTKRFKTLWGVNPEWSSKSPLVATAQEKHERDLLDEHLGLVDCAIRKSVIPQVLNNTEIGMS